MFMLMEGTRMASFSLSSSAAAADDRRPVHFPPPSSSTAPSSMDVHSEANNDVGSGNTIKTMLLESPAVAGAVLCCPSSSSSPSLVVLFMITLLEAPGSVRRGFASLEDEQTNEMFDDDDIEWSEEEEDNEPVEPNCVDRCLAVGRRPDEADFSEKWKREFSKRPTWFHADMALHQILRGRATGFRWPLYSRIIIQRSLFGIGCFVQRHAWLIIVFVLALFTLFCCGLRYVYIETDIVKLWVSEGGRLNEELNFLSTLQKANRRNLTQDSPYEQRHFLSEDLDERLFEIPEDEAPISSYQVLIQTADHLTPSRNVLTKKELLRHVQLLHEITQLRVHKFGMPEIC
uniref:Uncharacterized protein n=1 Tax=Globodera rostochiensis TaxID=31243 RepID=A0A914HFM4_GLORO